MSRMDETIPIDYTGSETDDESGGTVMAAVSGQLAPCIGNNVKSTAY